MSSVVRGSVWWSWSATPPRIAYGTFASAKIRASAKRAGRFVRSISPRNQYHCRSRMKPVAIPFIMLAIIAYVLSLHPSFPLDSATKSGKNRQHIQLTVYEKPTAKQTRGSHERGNRAGDCRARRYTGLRVEYCLHRRVDP